jgi:hypothetical protein
VEDVAALVGRTLDYPGAPVSEGFLLLRQ